METKEMRLIDANALMAVIEQEECNCEVFPWAINNAPTVEAVEVVHGRWLDNGMCNHKPSRFRNPDKWTVYKCSECGYSNGRRKNANYCPNCGAKMDGDGYG